jgi:subtilase family serine protease
MRKPLFPFSARSLVAIAIAAVLAACSTGGAVLPSGGADRHISSSRALPGESPTPTPSPSPTPGLIGGLIGVVGSVVNLVLAPACSGLLQCHTVQNTSAGADPNPHPLWVKGYTPKQLWAAYGLGTPTTWAAANGPTIAIVDAFDDPSAESDLAVYRSQFGLPPCTTANGCFSKLNGSLQRGGYPQADTGWSMEISLDLAMASSACPTCRITLVEAATNEITALAQAVQAIAATHPAAISNSYGVPESADALKLDAYYAHPGIAVTASIGDQAGVEFPASSANVIAVGGTTLKPAQNARGWSETALSQTGAGCSAYVSRPAWQTAACASRGVADVSFVADAMTGLAVYDTQSGGWIVLGGTSAGAPFVAGLYAAASDFGSGQIGAASLYANAAKLNVVSGVPAGETTLGSPHGLGAF